MAINKETQRKRHPHADKTRANKNKQEQLKRIITNKHE